MSSLVSLSNTSNGFSVNSATANKGTAVDKDGAEGLQDRFLTLLVAQMRNQDPLNPLDNSEVTSQLAQINTVNGISKLNDTMSLLSGNFNNLQLVQGAGMIGHSVMVPGTALDLSKSVGAAGFSLDQPVDNVQVQIKDANGQLLQKVDLGPRPAGVHGFSWDGKTDLGTVAADGRYTVQIKATQGGEEVTAASLSLGQVTSLTPGANGMQVFVNGLGQFNLSDVKQMI